MRIERDGIGEEVGELHRSGSFRGKHRPGPITTCSSLMATPGLWIPTSAWLGRNDGPLLSDLGQNKLIGRRQVEPRRDTEHGRDAGDHPTGGRSRVPAGGGKAMG